MSRSMKTFWLPGLISLTAFHLLWTAGTLVGLQVQFLNLGFVTIPVHLSLILALPLIGALGAYLSLRSGGSRWERLAAGIFPAIPLAVGYPIARLVNRVVHYTANTAPPTLTHASGLLLMVLAIVGQVLSLLVGVLPFLRPCKKPSETYSD
jgi:hypothetical protein